MATVEYGDWIIDVNIEKTKEFYSNYPSPIKNQVYMNYEKYCGNMPVDERQFFNDFAINPLCCQPETIGITKEKTLPVSLYFYIAGTYIKYPKENDPRINIGLFQFDFQNPNVAFSFIPEDTPQGFICIQVWIEELPWLLKDRCQIQMYYSPKFWQIFKKIREVKQNKLGQKQYFEEIKLSLKNDFKDMDISFELLNKKETKQVFRKWISEFIPQATKRKIKDAFVYGNRRYGNYLWHAFSYGFIPSESPEKAQACLLKIKKERCFLLLHNENLAYSILDAHAIDSSLLDKYNDILIFDDAFTWTYCHTHEEDLGPYFYNKKDPPPAFHRGAIDVFISHDQNKYVEVFEHKGVYTSVVWEKLFEESYDGLDYYYWCPINTDSRSLYDTKEKAMAEGKGLLESGDLQ